MLNLPAGIGRTRWPLYVLVGLVEIVVMYLVFRFLIVKMNLKTPAVRTAKKSPTLLQTQLLSSNRSAAAQPKDCCQRKRCTDRSPYRGRTGRCREHPEHR